MAPDLPTLPEETEFFYLAEGAANIVYRISIATTPEPSVLAEYGDGTPPPSAIDDNLNPFKEKLVRFRKNVPTTAPCAKGQENWEHLINPLFPQHQLVNQSLVKLHHGIIVKLNRELQKWEDKRPKKRQGIYLADDNYALLITDMTSNLGQEVIEFKPKWLLQSLSAPENSVRCRQCAYVSRVNASRARDGLEPLAFFCPLDLVSENRQDIIHATNILIQPNVTPYKVHQFARWLEHTDILEKIKAYQKEFDQVGVLQGDGEDEKFRCAMTLRDCTVFVRTTSIIPSEWEAKIGDLDLKSKTRVDHWRNTERLLIDEGWYKGLEKEEDKQPLMCQLSPRRFEMG